jgi:hypothetical protein
MVLSRDNQKTFHTILYGGTGALETLILRKRGNDQKQGTVKSYFLYDCRRGQIRKTGNTIQGDMTATHHVTWHIPVTELEQHGLEYLSALDQFIQVGDGKPEEEGWQWQPEGDTSITTKLFGDHFCVECHRRDSPDPRPAPPGAPNNAGCC